ncbi:MAG: class I SAM-dependent methyltransferase [Actinobacteria bacterium]|nr:class I SAM-dependent methyltransferase [Actinomycetota bacterium]
MDEHAALAIVRQGYDAVSCVYQNDTGSIAPGIRGEVLRDLATRLPRGGRVLDVGCGNGVPVARELARLGFDVVGVDISPVQISRARSPVTDATFLRADITAARFPPDWFDAVVAFWSIIHVPVSRQPGLLDRIATWSRPGAWFTATVGVTAWTGVEQDWLGVTGSSMYWSHTDRPTFRGWLTERGFTIDRENFVPEGESGHQWVLAHLA